jgi:pimeloyl-ACP methyl ester carboxylesterase
VTRPVPDCGPQLPVSTMWSTSAGSGVPVVMIHGAFCDFRYWEPQQIAFGRDRKAIALSLHGYYPDHEVASGVGITAEQHIQDVGAFLNELDLPAHVVGHSRGGRIALHVAARFPQRVRSLVLIEPGGIMAPDFLPESNSKQHQGVSPSVTDVRRAASELINRGGVEAGLRLYVDSGHGAGAWERAPSIFKRVAIANADSIDAMIADDTGALSASVARQVRAPTLMLAGSRSPAVFHKIIESLLGSIPNSQRCEFEGADHFLTLTAHHRVNRRAMEFWPAHELE